MAKTPIRTVRIEDALWHPAQDKAKRELVAYIGRNTHQEGEQR